MSVYLYGHKKILVIVLNSLPPCVVKIILARPNFFVNSYAPNVI